MSPRALTFRPIDPQRVRAVFAPPRCAPSLRGPLTTRAALACAGLSDSEIRLIGGFRGLARLHQDALLDLVSRAVIERVQERWRSERATTSGRRPANVPDVQSTRSSG